MKPRKEEVEPIDIPADPIDHLMQAMARGGETAFDTVPRILCVVIEDRLWQQRKDKDGNYFTSFEAFATHRLWHGLECSIEDLRAYCRKHPEIERLVLAEVGAWQEHGANQHTSEGVDNVNSTPGGNSASYTLKRLKRDRPDLAEKVVAGEMSANAAAIEAGFRKKPSPFEQVQKLLPKLTDEERRQLRELL